MKTTKFNRLLARSISTEEVISSCVYGTYITTTIYYYPKGSITVYNKHFMSKYLMSWYKFCYNNRLIIVDRLLTDLELDMITNALM